jgi:hypothetical protein
MASDRDHYEVYYADKLWALLPAVYRMEDSTEIDKPGPLRELCVRIGAQAAILRRGIDRLWEDQSIESCDDWVIPYIADLLATNLVAGLDARGQRLDVAKTIYYRRRKGTVAILEEIACDITGWEARVIEFCRRLGRTRHGLDPPVGLPEGEQFPDGLQMAEGLVGPLTRTAIGGWADLRNCYGASRAHSAFDEFFHQADFRRGCGRQGWYNIPNLGVFLWRLKSYGVDQTTPVAPDSSGCYSFDPTGREIPLFAAASRKEAKGFGDLWVSPEEWQLPVPIGSALLKLSLDRLYPDSMGVYQKPGVAGYVQVDPSKVQIDPVRGRFRVVDPEVTGALYVTYHYGFSSAIGAGAYDRRTREEEAIPAPDPPNPISGGGALTARASGTTTVADSLTYTSAADLTGIQTATLQAENEKRPVVRLGGAGTQWTFTGLSGANLTIDGLLVSGCDVTFKGFFDSVRLHSTTFDPGSSGAMDGTLRKAVDGRTLVPTRLWIEGTVRTLSIERCILGPIRTRNGGVLENLAVSDSILQSVRTAGFGDFVPADVKDPARLVSRLRDARDPVSRYLQSRLFAMGSALKKETSKFAGKAAPSAKLLRAIVEVLNAALEDASLFTEERFLGVKLGKEATALKRAELSGDQLKRRNRLLLEEAYPLELADLAIGLAEGEVRLEHVTVLGPMSLHRLAASECILNDVARVEDAQRGCIRFSAWAAGSVLPRKYESVMIQPGAPLFTTRQFGEPGYGQLTEAADRAIVAPETGGAISTGAQDGSEMGAFWREQNAIKERSLRVKYEEYMPVGLVPVVIHVT